MTEWWWQTDARQLREIVLSIKQDHPEYNEVQLANELAARAGRNRQTNTGLQNICIDYACNEIVRQVQEDYQGKGPDPFFAGTPFSPRKD